METDINSWAAFLGGLLTFFSPCMLPIVPGYLSFISGISDSSEKKPFQAFKHTIFFTLGFSIIFIILGTFFGALHSIFAGFQDWLNWIGGIIIISFGLFMMKLINIPFLNREKRVLVKSTKKTYFASLIMGSSFAIAWSPCVSAILASILVLTAVTSTQLQGAIMLAFFSLGLSIPFLITSLFLEKAKKVFSFSAKGLRYINIAAGILLIILGVFVFTGRFSQLINYFFFF